MSTRTSSEKTKEMKEEGRRLTDEARSRGEDVGKQAKKEAGRVLDDARSRARSQADDQAHRAAGSLRGMADQLDSMAEGAEEQGMMVDMAQQGADRIRRLAEHLEEGGVDGIVDDVQTFARRRPGAFIAAGVGIGMLFGRVLRASDTSAMKGALTGREEPAAGEQTSRPGPPTERERGPEDLGARSEPLRPEERPEPVTTRPQGPEAGRTI